MARLMVLSGNLALDRERDAARERTTVEAAGATGNKMWCGGANLQPRQVLDEVRREVAGIPARDGDSRGNWRDREDWLRIVIQRPPMEISGSLAPKEHKCCWPARHLGDRKRVV